MTCPTEDILETIARGDPVDAVIENHVASCRVCQDAVDLICENNSFLRVFADEISDGETALHSIDDAPLPDILPGGYRIEKEIHRGGHGVVYRATQIPTKRSVAVKMLILGSTATDRERHRFEREAEIIASLRHPGIVTIFDAGRFDDGRFAFAMEFIDGPTLDKWAESNPVLSKGDIRSRLVLFTQICDAVGFAHQHGVVHRDLKPANILVDKADGPHILDFGIAKALEPVGLGSIASMGANRSGASSEAHGHNTLPGEFAGTLAYASPEQVSGDPASIDMRTDVYSLGIILYQLMAGTYPYEVNDSVENVVHRIKHDSPKPPSAHARFLDTDIDEIVLGALRKDKSFRYDSVSDLHRDIVLYLEGKPIDTRRDSAWYVAQKTVRRHWLVSLLSIASAVSTVVVAVVMTVLYSQKLAAEVDAKLEIRARNLLLAHSVELHDDGWQALNLLWNAQLEPGPGLPPPGAVRFGGAFEPLDSYWELWSFYARNPCITTVALNGGHPYRFATSTDGSQSAVLDSGTLRVRTLPELEVLHDVALELGPSLKSEFRVDHLVFSTDQESIFALTDRGTTRWGIKDGSLISHLPMPPLDLQLPQTNVYLLAPQLSTSRVSLLSPDGVLGVADRDTVRLVWPSQPADVVTLNTGTGHNTTARFNDAGNLLATATIDVLDYNTAISTLSVWDVPRATLLSRLETDGRASGLLFSSDDTSLVWTDTKTRVKQWDFSSSDLPEALLNTDGVAVPHCWFGESKDFVTSTDRTLRLSNSHDGRVVRKLQGHSSRIYHAVAPAGTSSLVSFGFDNAKSWEPNYRPWWTVSDPFVEETLQDLAISPDGNTLAWSKSASGRYSIMLTDLRSRETRAELTEPLDLVNSVCFGRDGRLLAAAGMDGVVMVWDSRTGEVLHRFTEHTAAVHSVAMSPTGNLLASGGDDNAVVVRDLDTGHARVLTGHTQRVPEVVFSPNGRRLVSCSVDGTVRLWDVRTGNLITSYEIDDRFHAISFSPDGHTLAVGGRKNRVVLINTQTGVTRMLEEEPGVIFALAFGPEGRVLVSGDNLGHISLWDVEREVRLTRFPKHPDMVLGISVSPDGRYMASCSSAFRPEIRYWDLAGLAPHIAGNLEYHADELAKTQGKKPANLDAMRRWADEVRGPD